VGFLGGALTPPHQLGDLGSAMSGGKTEGREQGWFLGEGHLTPPHQLRGPGERYELPQLGSGQSPDSQRFPLFSALRIWPLLTL